MNRFLARVGNPVLGPNLNSPQPSQAGKLFGKVISGFLNILILGGLIFFLIQFLIGGIKWILSEGSEDKVKTARNQIRDAFVGLTVILVIFAIIKLIGQLFGISSLEQLQIPLMPLI